jgi:hypothetical protein
VLASVSPALPIGQPLEWQHALPDCQRGVIRGQGCFGRPSRCANSCRALSAKFQSECCCWDRKRCRELHLGAKFGIGRAAQSCGRHFTEQGSIAHCEAAEFEEAVIGRNFRDGLGRRVAQ